MTAYPVPTDWTVYGTLNKNGVPFSAGKVYADRLYKIRNSLNIQGVKRTLALFAPPIAPGMLAKARAMGISIDSVLNSTNEKLPIYRFRVIVKLAVDMAKDAKQLAKCDKAVVAESKAANEMEIKSLEAEKVLLEEKKAAAWRLRHSRFPILNTVPLPTHLAAHAST